jgi:hypothetical protein
LNIFATYGDPQLCSIFLDDKRVRKMLQESVDLLCTTLVDHPLAKPTFYQHHPATKWVKEDYAHQRWLFLHASYLSFECEFRFDRTDYVHQDRLEQIAPLFAQEASAPLWFYRGASHQGLKLDFNHMDDIHEAYRMYLRTRWPGDFHTPRWTNRDAQDYG